MQHRVREPFCMEVFADVDYRDGRAAKPDAMVRTRDAWGQTRLSHRTSFNHIRLIDA